jgi:putative phosphoribosyl transferase
MTSFTDRADAGRKLAAALAGYRDRYPVVLALPRGGVPVAAVVAEALHAPLDLVLVRKIGVPYQPELAMGAVVDGDPPIVVRNQDVIEHARITEREFQAVCDRELEEIERRRDRYLRGRPRAPIAGRVVIVIDDGVATGATIRAALRAMRQRKPELLVLAVPVGPSATIDELGAEADAVVCLEEHRQFVAIGLFYADFTQTTDEEVLAALAAHQPG